MGWIILGLVFLAVTYLSLKGTIIEYYFDEDLKDEYYVPIWLLIVLGLLYILPIVGIILFIIYIITFCVCTTWKPRMCRDRLIFKTSDKNVLHRILKGITHFLTKSI